MPANRILVKTIDTNIEYDTIGIDLAKNCVSAVLLTVDGEVFGLDRGMFQNYRVKFWCISPCFYWETYLRQAR